MKNKAVSPAPQGFPSVTPTFSYVPYCFDNKCGNFLIDDREDHKTDPETLWFIAPTNEDRWLKVAFMFIDGTIHIKSAFDPYESEIALYNEMGK